jgi:hypothetical protein
MKKKFFFKLLLLVLLLSACTQGAGSPLSTPTVSPTAVPSEQYLGNQNQYGYPSVNDNPDPYPEALAAQGLPEEILNSAPDPLPGKASISGIVYSYTTNMIIPKTQGYLTRGKGSDHKQIPPLFVGPLEDQLDIVFTTDENGYFELNNIPPGNYFLAIWAPYTYSVMQVSNTDPTYRMIELLADSKDPLGIVYVSWP